MIIPKHLRENLAHFKEHGFPLERNYFRPIDFERLFGIPRAKLRKLEKRGTIPRAKRDQYNWRLWPIDEVPAAIEQLAGAAERHWFHFGEAL